VFHGTIQKLEEEERRPSAQIVGRLEEIFNIPPNERAAFLRFARGEMRSVIAGRKEESPWNTPAKTTRFNLPIPVTSCIERGKEIAEVRCYLSRAEIRLVTMIGPPGIGKTRLSMEAARAAFPDFPDGAFFVGLAPLEHPGLIALKVIQALGYVGARDASPVEQLREGIGDKCMLVVLDNCEHLIEDLASFASSLLSACSRLKILATSR
jgi:hypothetical protein